MKKEYETYINSLDQLPTGKELDLEIRSLAPGKYKYEVKRVRAILSRTGESSGGDILKLRFPLGAPSSETMSIKIVKELS